MKLAYLLSFYPMASTTFIRREIEALEALGQPVARISVRHWDTPLVDPIDIAEEKRTDYLLTGSKSAFLRDALLGFLTHPLRALRTLPLAWRLYRQAGTGLVAHAAYYIEALAFLRRAARLGIAHAHVHFANNAAAVALLARHMGGPPFSITVHGPDELVNKKTLSLADKARGADFLLAITDYCRGEILAEAPDVAEKVHVLRCGIDLTDFAYDPTPTTSPRIVCVGRLCHNKGQKHIPAAVAQVRAEFPDIVVDLLGGGPDEALIRAEIAKYEVENNIVLHGWATSDQVRAGIATSRALLLPSYAEGLPIVIMEALAIGRPVLTTRITGIPELVDSGCGWLFEPGDVDAIAEALRGVMRATAAQRAAMGAEGRRRVEERHDLHKSAAQLLGDFEASAGEA
ncbi:MAG: glycosyltransferase family 4 protein [Sphingobium sp.]|nr:glycosyltransferase family 4 protein [Sphingobium sp.]